MLSSVLISFAATLAVNVGQTAPVFSLSTYKGGTFNLAQQQGKVVVLFFLGCT
jgi:peroxiredoxin